MENLIRLIIKHQLEARQWVSFLKLTGAECLVMYLNGMHLVKVNLIGDPILQTGMRYLQTASQRWYLGVNACRGI